MQFTRISVQQAVELWQSGSVVLADIRDPASYAGAHVTGSVHLTQNSLAEFVEETPKTTPVLVLCYHGNSSQGVANYLASLGYQSVYSVDGGFESWRLQYPTTTSV